VREQTVGEPAWLDTPADGAEGLTRRRMAGLEAAYQPLERD